MDEKEQVIEQLLSRSQIIAVVGLSSKADRPSHEVAAYLLSNGYRIVPVNPMYAGTYILGEYCQPSLSAAAEMLKKEGATIDIVDCFRKSEQVGEVVDEAIAVGARGVWMQLGVIDLAAAARAEQAGLTAIVDKCIKIEHRRLHAS